MTDQINYILHLADNALVLGHRNSEWCGHGPVLEQDIAITNISLDLIGQARNFYQYAAQLINAANDTAANPATEDSLAYLRDADDFKNCVLVELPKGDWAQTSLRQFFFSNYQFNLYQQLQHNPDEQLAAIAVKALKEVTYHLRWSSEWVIRLADGTTESNRRIRQALDFLWPYTGELFMAAPYEYPSAMASATGNDQLSAWMERTQEIFDEAGLAVPAAATQQTAGKIGQHSPHLTAMLEEMQVLQRTYPDAQW